MVNIKTNKQYKTTKNNKTRKRCKSLSNNKRRKGGGDGVKKKPLMKLDVYVTPDKGGVKRKIEFNVSTFHGFYDYLNEVDMFLKNTLNEELMAFTDPNRYNKLKNDNPHTLKSYAVNLEKESDKVLTSNK
jgi:hypothetical protein